MVGFLFFGEGVADVAALYPPYMNLLALPAP
jgi:hypothetical protein